MEKFRLQSRIGLLSLLSLTVVGINSEANAQQSASSPKKIGLVASLFEDVSPATEKKLPDLFSDLVVRQTGMQFTSVTVEGALNLAEQLEEKKIQIGVYNGFEFAWAQQKHPQLKPLMVAEVTYPKYVAYLVVRDDSKVSGFADLKGKKVALPKRSRPHSRFYLQQEGRISENTNELAFEVVKQPNIEEGLDDVVRGDVAAIVVDRLSLEIYGRLKPGCLKRLKIVEKSPTFPASAIVYRDGFVDKGTLAKLKKGLLNAHNDSDGRFMMSIWRVTSFLDMPQDYYQTLAGIRNAYPHEAGD